MLTYHEYLEVEAQASAWQSYQSARLDELVTEFWESGDFFEALILLNNGEVINRNLGKTLHKCHEALLTGNHQTMQNEWLKVLPSMLAAMQTAAEKYAEEKFKEELEHKSSEWPDLDKWH